MDNSIIEELEYFFNYEKKDFEETLFFLETLVFCDSKDREKIILLQNNLKQTENI